MGFSLSKPYLSRQNAPFLALLAGFLIVLAALSALVKTMMVPKGGDLSAYAVGELENFIVHDKPKPVPDVPFYDEAGNEYRLSDFKGQVLLVNLWATWCAPCLTEMPTLDNLQKEMGSDRFQVMALSVDKKGIEVSREFLDRVNSPNVKLYSDPTFKMAIKFTAHGLPATILIDKHGREIGRIVAPAEWDSADAKRMIKAALGEGD